jgi:hypothetical protein
MHIIPTVPGVRYIFAIDDGVHFGGGLLDR